MVSVSYSCSPSRSGDVGTNLIWKPDDLGEEDYT